MASRVWESCALGASVDSIWAAVRALDLKALQPGLVRSVAVEGDAPVSVGSVVHVEYNDGVKWDLKVIELSDLDHRVSWEVFHADPPAQFSSRVDTIHLMRISRSGHAFLEWFTDFSSDAGPEVLADCKHKKLEAFKAFRASLSDLAAAAGAESGAGAGSGRAKERANKESGARIEGGGLIGGDFSPTEEPEFKHHRLALLDQLSAEQREELAKKPREPIKVVLPDGKEVDGVSWETTPLAIAQGISKKLAKVCMVAKVKYLDGYQPEGFVDCDEEDEEAGAEDTGALHGREILNEGAADDGILWDMSRPLEHSCHIRLLKFDDPDGRMTFWHSSAHVLGEAMERAFGVNLCIGPPLKEGFYYDAYAGSMVFDEPALTKIGALAEQVVRENQPFERVVLTKEQALELFRHNPFKVQLISNKIPDGGKTTAYRCGPLVDLCTGPHLPTTGMIRAFHIHKNSSAYWLGNAENDNLQRVYGVSFPDTKDLKHWLKVQEQVKQRDHRVVGERQELFFFHELSPGSAFFQPAGARIYNKLVSFIRNEYWIRGYEEVITPNVFNFDLWKTSGHADHYRDDMFLLQVDKQEFGLKPMNCPGHCLMFGHRLRSYRELPIRMADFGVLHRNEAHGALTGLTRVRRFQQDDAHIFCRLDQIRDEVLGVLDFIRATYGRLGMTYNMKLSTRPSKALGDIELWRVAETNMADALDEFCGKGKWGVNWGDGAFYGPKIDIEVFDALGRQHQCATVQLDFQLPLRFKLEYKSSDDSMQRPVIVHRAVLGSVERMMAILTEHFGGKWPLWLSPRQIMVVPVSLAFNDYAEEVARIFHQHGFYAEADTRHGVTMNKKIRQAQLLQWNYMLVVGAKEQESRTVNIRTRENQQPGEKSIEETVKDFLAQVERFE